MMQNYFGHLDVKDIELILAALHFYPMQPNSMFIPHGYMGNLLPLTEPQDPNELQKWDQTKQSRVKDGAERLQRTMHVSAKLILLKGEMLSEAWVKQKKREAV